MTASRPGASPATTSRAASTRAAGTGTAGTSAAGTGTTARVIKKKIAVKKRRKPDPVKAWVRRLDRTRPGLTGFVLEGLESMYGKPTWERRLDPTSELVLTILTQNSADTNAEKAFELLRLAYPSGGPVEEHRPGPGWGGKGLSAGAAPDWMAVERAPLEELIEVIRPGGLPVAKAKGILAALRAIREARGDHSLEFLGDLPALEARQWLTQIPGIGKKTASVLLLFSFGTPLMPVDRHVERVARRIGLLPAKSTTDPHDFFLAMLEPDQMYEAHVNLIQHGRVVCHARSPEHERCPVRDRCRFVNPKAP
jgi:endonuclease-3